MHPGGTKWKERAKGKNLQVYNSQCFFQNNFENDNLKDIYIFEREGINH